jgi:hypothetical protein
MAEQVKALEFSTRDDHYIAQNLGTLDEATRKDVLHILLREGRYYQVKRLAKKLLLESQEASPHASSERAEGVKTPKKRRTTATHALESSSAAASDSASEASSRVSEELRKKKNRLAMQKSRAKERAPGTLKFDQNEYQRGYDTRKKTEDPKLWAEKKKVKNHKWKDKKKLENAAHVLDSMKTSAFVPEYLQPPLLHAPDREGRSSSSEPSDSESAAADLLMGLRKRNFGGKKSRRFRSRRRRRSKRR